MVKLVPAGIALALAVMLCVSAATGSGASSDVGGLLLAFMAVILFASGIIAGICALAQRASRSDVHEHTGTVRLEHSGTIRHEVAGSVQHTVQHVGTVHHEHALSQADRARLDRLEEQRMLEEAEMAQLQRAELRRKLDEAELVRLEYASRRELTAGPDGIYR